MADSTYLKDAVGAARSARRGWVKADQYLRRAEAAEAALARVRAWADACVVLDGLDTATGTLRASAKTVLGLIDGTEASDG